MSTATSLDFNMPTRWTSSAFPGAVEARLELDKQQMPSAVAPYWMPETIVPSARMYSQALGMSAPGASRRHTARSHLLSNPAQIKYSKNVREAETQRMHIRNVMIQKTAAQRDKQRAKHRQSNQVVDIHKLLFRGTDSMNDDRRRSQQHLSRDAHLMQSSSMYGGLTNKSSAAASMGVGNTNMYHTPAGNTRSRLDYMFH